MRGNLLVLLTGVVLNLHIRTCGTTTPSESIKTTINNSGTPTKLIFVVGVEGANHHGVVQLLKALATALT